jgi:hypothetical protein
VIRRLLRLRTEGEGLVEGQDVRQDLAGVPHAAVGDLPGRRETTGAEHNKVQAFGRLFPGRLDCGRDVRGANRRTPALIKG